MQIAPKRASWFISSLLILSAAAASRADPLAGTQPLTTEGDLAAQMVEGIDRFLLQETDASIARRADLWKRDVTSPQRYEESVGPNRGRLAKMLGVVDTREKFDALELVASTTQPALFGRGKNFDVYAVRWPVIGVMHGEGLMLVPAGGGPAVADLVALPDADQTPEMLAGLSPGVPAESQFARRLAECGCRVIVPTLLDRSDTNSQPASGQHTNQTGREYVWRPAYEMGRHPIGYELQKVLAAVDWFSTDAQTNHLPANIGVLGYGEGGLLAFYAAALDPRIHSACVSGYFGGRQELWREPIYRDVFGLLREFGDAEIASLIAPRSLVIEACKSPEVDGPPAPRDGRKGAAPGRLTTPRLEDVRAELSRATALLGGAALGDIKLCASGADGRGPFGTDAALTAMLHELGSDAPMPPSGPNPESLCKAFDPQPRQKRQVDEMQELTQSLVRQSEFTRAAYWQKADHSSLESWRQSIAAYRQAFADDLIGRFDRPLLPPAARTRQIYDEPKYVGYEVVLDVYPDVFASGILLVPKGIAPGERRPVVVCQHGLEGRPSDVADPKSDSQFYHRFACKLAEQGFITYAPQNPYIGQDRFRTLVRKGHPIGKTLFSIIVPQHQQTVDWLATLPFVDGDRVAFYGLSYGGKAAMRVPALVDRYCLSICSGDFNQWVWKTTSLTYPASYPGTNEYDMYEWDLGNTFNYAEMAALIAPRPFMVERGHKDGVGRDEWVAYEYAKVARLYADLKISDRTCIEYFDGPHTIHGVGTFQFLREQLHWPAGAGR